MEKKYGVRLSYKDDVPGCRDSWTEYEWFETKKERQKYVENLKHKPVQSPKDEYLEQMIEDEQGGRYDVLTNVELIERQ